MYSEDYLKKNYCDELHSYASDFDGCVMQDTFGLFKDKILNMEVRNDDVWVTSFPKSGTTWCQEMVWLIGNDFNYEKAQKDHHDRYPFLEAGSVMNFVNYQKNHPEFDCPKFLLDPVSFIDSIPSPRYIKSHLPWNLLPLQIQNGTKKPKIIHTIRNPKDIVVSYHNHTEILHGYKGSLKDFFKLFLTNQLHYTPYFNNVLSFWNNRHLDNLLILRYEDMQKDLQSVIKIVAKFMNKEIPEEEIPRLLKHLSFEEMSKNPAVNFEVLIQFLKTLNVYEIPDKKFMRKGKSGSYKESFTPEMIEAMDEWIEKNCKGTGLNFE